MSRTSEKSIFVAICGFFCHLSSCWICLKFHAWSRTSRKHTSSYKWLCLSNSYLPMALGVIITVFHFFFWIITPQERTTPVKYKNLLLKLPTVWGFLPFLVNENKTGHQKKPHLTKCTYSCVSSIVWAYHSASQVCLQITNTLNWHDPTKLPCTTSKHMARKLSK